MPTMLMGVKGSIAAGQAVILPELGVQMVEAIWAKDYERAVAIQMLLIDLNEKLHPLHEYGKRDTTEGLRIRGFAVKEYPRWPTKEMTPEHLKLYESNIKRVLDELGNLSKPALAAE